MQQLENLLKFYCKYYSRFPDSIFGIVDVHEPVLEYHLERMNQM